jgi:hypothetical protein
MHQLSAMFCTAVVAAPLTAHVKTLLEIAGETVDTAKKRPLVSGLRRPRRLPEDGALLISLEFLYLNTLIILWTLYLTLIRLI